MKQRVVYFTDSTDFGGAEQALLHLLGGLDRTRWAPVLFYHPAPGIAPLLAATQDLQIETQAVAPMSLGRAGAKQIPAFVQQVRTQRPAVFHAHLTWPLACKYGLVGAFLARIPATVATTHLFFELPYTLATRLQQRVLAARLGRLIAVSQGLAQRWQQVFKIHPNKLRVIRNAIPTQRFTCSPVNALRGGWQDEQKRPVILTVARLDQQKGHRFLLEAASQIPEACFIFAGDGPERAALTAQAEAAGLRDRCYFLGQRNDIPELLASCDLFVLPSLFEGLPLAVLEAMAASKPVITSDIPGSREVVTHNVTGLLTPPGDPAALATAIRRLLDCPAERQHFATAARARVQRDFSVETMVQQVEQVYEELLHNQRGGL